jgi:hypothetical protein
VRRETPNSVGRETRAPKTLFLRLALPRRFRAVVTSAVDRCRTDDATLTYQSASGCRRCCSKGHAGFAARNRRGRAIRLNGRWTRRVSLPTENGHRALTPVRPPPFRLAPSFSPFLHLKPQPSQWTGKATALGAFSLGAFPADDAVAITPTTKFAGFPSKNGEPVTLIEHRFVSNDTFAFVSVVRSADGCGKRPGVFIQIVHDIEPSGREPLGVHINQPNNTWEAVGDQLNILWTPRMMGTRYRGTLKISLAT